MQLLCHVIFSNSTSRVSPCRRRDEGSARAQVTAGNISGSLLNASGNPFPASSDWAERSWCCCSTTSMMSSNISSRNKRADLRLLC